MTAVARPEVRLPARDRAPQLADFRVWCAEAAGNDLGAPGALHEFSVSRFREFWRLLLDWSDLAWEGSAEVVCTDDDVERARFFPDVRLNYAENLLRPLPEVDDDAPALTAVHADGSADVFSRARLRTAVRSIATVLADLGIDPDRRVVLVAPNNSHAVTAALAVSALGAAVSSGMPDMGPSALLGRFEQVEPAVLVLDRAGLGGWSGSPGDTLHTLVEGLPTVRTVLVLDDAPLPVLPGVRCLHLRDALPAPGTQPAPWPRLPFDQPLFVMFTSGTTGPPKAMVHGAGGTLLEHVKEHRLHGDLDHTDTLYFHTTTAWMMWNWQLSALAVGAHVVVYDGPVRGPQTLWQLVADRGVTVFGTSPTYLQLCQDAGHRPADRHDLSRVRAVLSTGSVLHDWQFDWFADAVGPQPLQSISGGTDLIGCFVLGHPELPVHRGRCQARSLGLDVAAVDAAGHPVIGEVGELVCRRPFPSRPRRFLRDPDGARMHQAYFAEHPGKWTHGDLIEIGEDGSARMHGRSDGILNIDGVRIGQSEIYRVLRGLPELADAMAVEQRDGAIPGLSRLVLLVVLCDGSRLDRALEQRIRATLRGELSAAHMPSLVLAVPELPHTHNGKRSERAAQDTLNGNRVGNLAALRNPGSLDGIARAAAEAAAGHATAVTEDSAVADETTRLVTRLWRGTLGPDADTDGTFWLLGGTSRQSMTMLRRLRVELGRDVAMETFLADPTLDGLMAAAHAAVPAAGASPVMRLAAGRPGLPPLFFVNDAWGDIDVYWPAAQLLEGNGPVHGLRVALEDPDGTPRSVAEIAEAGVEALCAVTPEGPVRLSGHSFGGLVAYEMARLLAAREREVDVLGLLDVLPPTAGLRLWERVVVGFASRLATVVPSLTNLTLRQVVTARVRPSALPPDHQVLLRSGRAYNAHRPGPYDGPVTYFRARRRLPGVQHMLRSWRRVAPRLTVINVPGCHHDVLGQDNVAETTALMSRVLLSASARLDGR